MIKNKFNNRVKNADSDCKKLKEEIAVRESQIDKINYIQNFFKKDEGIFNALEFFDENFEIEFIKVRENKVTLVLLTKEFDFISWKLDLNKRTRLSKKKKLELEEILSTQYHEAIIYELSLMDRFTIDYPSHLKTPEEKMNSILITYKIKNTKKINSELYY